MPGRSPRRYTVPAMASSSVPAAAKASGAPEAITVIWPAAAFTAPPETGASISHRPRSASCSAQAGGRVGSTVAEAITTAPRRSVAARPLAPNSTVSVCAALTTSTSTASACAPSSANESVALPPAAVKRSRASARVSRPSVTTPLRSAVTAAPKPIEPRPTTPSTGAAARLRPSPWPSPGPPALASSWSGFIVRSASRPASPGRLKSPPLRPAAVRSGSCVHRPVGARPPGLALRWQRRWPRARRAPRP